MRDKQGKFVGVKDFRARFYSYVAKTTPNACWLWTGWRSKRGYGRIKIYGKYEAAHRIAYMLVKGAIPDKLLVRHTCDNPSCVNPSHLLVGTDADNARDKMARGRHKAPKKYPSAHIFKILEEYDALPKGPKGRCSPGVSAAFLKKYDLPSQTLSNWLKEFSISF